MDLKQKKVLLIDDDDMIRKMYEVKFKKEGLDIRTAKNGKEGIALLEKDKKLPELILLDLLMPGMSGYEVLEILKKNEKTKNIPVLLLTNLSAPEDQTKHGVKKGAEGYLVKSKYTPQEILEQIKPYLK